MPKEITLRLKKLHEGQQRIREVCYNHTMKAYPPERFWPKVDKTPDCWLWIAALDGRGYGKVAWRENGQQYTRSAHRYSWEFAYGRIPDGLEIDHLCRTPRCVRPDHMEAVTHAENLRRSTSISTLNAAKTACPRGHAYDYVDPRGNRGCKTCSAERQRQRRYRLSHAARD